METVLTLVIIGLACTVVIAGYTQYQVSQKFKYMKENFRMLNSIIDSQFDMSRESGNSYKKLRHSTERFADRTAAELLILKASQNTIIEDFHQIIPNLAVELVRTQKELNKLKKKVSKGKTS